MTIVWHTHLKKAKGAANDNKYDMGREENLKFFLGEHKLMWLCPTPPRSDGFSFPTRLIDECFDDDIVGSSGIGGYTIRVN